MRSAKAIFIKQLQDIFKNSAVLVQFVIFPFIALVMTELVAKADETIPDTMFIITFSTIFTGMTLIITTTSTIAEDRENKSLRFLVMAGVKPHEYMLGIGGVIMSASVLVTFVFALMGGFAGREFFQFVIIMLLGSVASILLGATIGILSKNQQASIGLSMPIAMILGFSPMVTMFNETVEKFFRVFYTQQINTVVNDFSANMTESILVILGNIVVLMAVFVLVYKKKGLRS